jgi:ubiquinone biosynthesis protein
MSRSRHILAVLSKHGLDWLLSHLESEVLPRRTPHDDHGQKALRKEAANLRHALEELGPTFIKLGQALSTRHDLLPSVYIEELYKLQDEVPATPFEIMKPVIEGELGHPLQEVFSLFEEEPIASASIGQVYGGRLLNGEAVVIKIHRAGAEQLIQQDLEILTDIVSWAMQHTVIGKMYDLTSLLDEFIYRLRSELDYHREGHNAELIREQFKEDPDIYIPKIYWEYTTPHLIMLERMSGLKITDLKGIDHAGISRKTVAENLAGFILRQLFEFGFFHADPHPGNFYVQPDGSLAVMDFGMVGRFSEPTKKSLIRLALAVGRGDTDAIVDVMLDMGMTSKRIQRHALEQDIGRLIETYATGNYQYMATSQILNQVTSVAFRHGLQLPSELLMLGRLISLSEGISLKLYPQFRMLDFSTPYLKEFWEQERSLSKILPRLGEIAQDGLELSMDLPREASRLLKQVERGQLEFNVNYEGLREFSKQMQRMTNRLALAILLSATIVALGLVLVIYHPATWQQLGEFVFGFAFISSLCFGAWLIFSIMRSGR